MTQLFNDIFYQPIFNFLVWIYNLLPNHDLGLAIIILTLIIRLILFPLAQKQIRSQRSLTKLQPKIEELKLQYKDNKEALGKAMMDLYKQEKINPLSSCLPLLIQLPFLLAVYWVFKNGLSNGSLDLLYPFVHNPGSLNPVTLGFFDLSVKSIPLAILAGAAQFWQSKMMIGKQKAQGTAAAMNKQMLYIMPAFTVYIGWVFPAGLTLYWFVTILFSIVQQKILFRQMDQMDKTAAPSVK